MTLCKNCGKNPAQNYMRRINGKDVPIPLCPSCYRELYGTGDSEHFPVSPPPSGGKKRCPACGTTFEDFRRTGLLGCARCYSEFRNELLPTIRSLQGEIRHTGKGRHVDEEYYDMLRALVDERESVRLRLRRAREEGNTELEERLSRSLEEIERRLSGEEE